MYDLEFFSFLKWKVIIVGRVEIMLRNDNVFIFM